MAVENFHSGSSPRRRSVRMPSQTRVDSASAVDNMKDDQRDKTCHVGTASGSGKLGTFTGVFVPTSLNVLSILMFLRFGMIMGQSGVLGMMCMLVACYAIDLLTTMSISAIATNGTVRGGGTYYLISRSLGPEFGGAIGVVFYLGCVFNTGMNAVGLVDCLNYNFGRHQGGWSNWLPDSFWWSYLWATLVLVICSAICLAGSSLFARASNALLVILLIATFSIPFSALFMQPFESRKLGIEYTGLSLATFKSNLLPNLTKGADGSQLDGKETWQDLFGILFPATSGIFAGASMSGDLKHPSKAIPKGTLSGLLLTFLAYTFVILSLAATITRESFYRNVNLIQDVNVSGTIILLGEFATSFFSSLMGVIGSAKLLQALARDNLIPGLSIFGEGSKRNDEPRYAILITHVVAQLTMLSDLNQIASLVTMSYLMTFLVTNLACFLLKIGSAPNFRPSFRYFSWQSAATGAVVSLLTMFYVDGVYASGCVAVLIVIFIIIHYSASPKSWGDVSQSLIYHQVRKYLLRLRQEHVKFWRPSILLLINDPRRQFKLVQFCNSLKKGGLFILAHVIVTDDFKGSVPEAKRQQSSWSKYVDFSKIKGFINISVSPSVIWGIRNIILSSGLGGMRPNIVVMGFFNLNDLRQSQPLIDIPSPQHSRSSSIREDAKPKPSKPKTTKKSLALHQKLLGLSLPTDANRPEGSISAKSYVTILEDVLLRLRINVAIAKGFDDLELPGPKPTTVENIMSLFKTDNGEDDLPTKYIDLWPVQMSAFAQIDSVDGEERRSILTTNFDTYTLILQLGCILGTVDSWERTFKLRVSVFVEYEGDVAEERQRIASLLYNLRIKAEIRVFWLANGSLKTYEVIVNGRRGDGYGQTLLEVDDVLEDEDWWQETQRERTEGLESETFQQLSELTGSPRAGSPFRQSSYKFKLKESSAPNVRGLRKIMRKAKRRVSIGPLNRFPAEMRLHLSSLDPNLIENHRTYTSASESSSSEDDFTDPDYDDRAASENDIESSSDDDDEEHQIVHRSRSFNASTPLRTHQASQPAETGDLSLLKTRATTKPLADVEHENVIQGESSSQKPPKSAVNTLRRPPAMRQHSMPKFTSRPVPPTTIPAEDGPGPSIMFLEQQPPSVMYSQSRGNDDNSKASPDKTPENSPNPAGGFPAQQSVPLSFNDLPSRAQHLILNELMAQHSLQAAVLFTTLPSPVEGTCDSEAESINYLSDVEVLCMNLPPILLVHSNTVTVTMSL